MSLTSGKSAGISRESLGLSPPTTNHEMRIDQPRLRHMELNAFLYHNKQCGKQSHTHVCDLNTTSKHRSNAHKEESKIGDVLELDEVMLRLIVPSIYSLRSCRQSGH